MAQRRWQAWLKLSVCSMLTALILGSPEWFQTLLAALGFETTPCSIVWTEDLSDSEGWAFSYRSAECQMNSTMSGSFGIVVSSYFQPVAVQYPRQKSPVLSLNALAEFCRRHLAERREAFSLQGLRVSAWWSIQQSWWSSVHFLSHIAVCGTVDLEKTLCKSFAFPPPPPQRSCIQTLTFPILEATCFLLYGKLCLSFIAKAFLFVAKSLCASFWRSQLMRGKVLLSVPFSLWQLTGLAHFRTEVQY